MRRLLPPPADPGDRDVDVMAVYAADERPAKPHRPWVMLNMISSIDGGISVDGRSGALGGPADRRIFTAIRAVPDVILVGAGTVAAEHYRPPMADERVRRLRRERGQADVPRLAIVTGRLRVDLGSAVFADANARPIVITGGDAPAERIAEVRAAADVVRPDHGPVDLPAALSTLWSDGVRTVLCEGGPSLNGSLLEAGLVDEVCLTVSPTVVGGEGPGIVAGAPAALRELELRRVLEESGFLFCRYVKRAGAAW